MKLEDLATIKTNMKDADFWLVRKGTPNALGTPTKQFSEEHIGIKVTSDKVLPDFLFYAMEFVKSGGYWHRHHYGTLRLKHIRVEDVKKLEVGMTY